MSNPMPCVRDDNPHHFKGLHGFASKCRRRIFSRDGQYVVLFTSLNSDNDGTSITNWIEHLCKEAYDLLGQPQDITYVEHYPKRGMFQSFPESFDEVMLTNFASPQWTRITLAQLEKRIEI